ncbi:rhomboid family intramembrane serine protease [Streptomyces hydrogenans]|uniref:Rhomboid family intramembrane serine protease n=1 Tax=Streptomyces hydrogenans TaxID=1873719 RepID=A0ABQ3PHW1_9ACTN|nr:rhomboid family intramembrane serine protease [Streptomyces hydrogenans]GHG34417.1 rhomboid family intramembrane serine protease [Streptomyces hydrogenans]GHI21498.1 rhomboid family intramembrane serine protease [Streptomyces hydrogenans]GHI24610.1 rhomboid family intramembrane serine protease [Streptomyces hydrogenans]GHI24631.1 rhomboid family intramembrane serine protease [Streptomyces hydrogenans]GHI26991.1 rhomboid family intramembrane serine protease [Streptomyces hydrogenans]
MIDWRGTALGAYRNVRTGPAVTYGLIAACCLLFIVSPVSGLNPSYGTGDEVLAAQSAYFQRWGVVPAELVRGDPGALLTPFTALFVHGGWLHLLGNMLFLWVFGAMAEERMGHVEFALFYLGTGYLALLGYALAHADSEQTLVGASGAISAVLGGFLFLFPRSRVTSLFPFLFFLPLRFPAWAVLVFWFTLQWLAARAAGAGPGVAYLAHVVGFSVGFLYAWARFRGGDRVKSPAAATEGDSQP